MKQKGSRERGVVVGKKVMVAVRASKEIPKAALLWTLTHVVQPGDRVRLLVVVPSNYTSKKIWGFSRFTSDCASGYGRFLAGTDTDRKDDIHESCSQMMFQLHNVYDADKINVRIKIVFASPYGVIAAEAKKSNSNWVILDRGLKYEKKCCMEQLECNLVVIKKSQPKVIRLNLVKNADTAHPQAVSTLTSKSVRSSRQGKKLREPFVTPASSPDQEGSSSHTTTDMGTTSSISSSDAGASPFLASQVFEGLNPWVSDGNKSFFESNSDSDGDKWSPLSMASSSVTASVVVSPSGDLFKPHTETPRKSRFASVLRLGSSRKEPEAGKEIRNSDTCLNKSVREVVSLSRKPAPGPPPLCSVCQHKAPKFGNPPRWFTYGELETATKGFSKGSFLAEGGFGSVHRGTLPDGQIIAVKQYKIASTQGDREFCSEVEVLSCAQHRNVVMLIGLCVEDGKRLLVYEYICNGSLHSHLYGLGKEPLGWSARQKVAVGAARGLRYLHEECRVGCIVHRDMRPNNILLTHDFEPLVGDFGLARWQPEGDKGVETRVIGTFGYLAPEYAQSGQITEKADVYSFGVVLVELITGRKAMDIKRPKGQQCLTEWARPLLQKQAIKELLDPRLMNCYSEQEVYCMALCAYLCIRRDPNSRPRMSQVGDFGLARLQPEGDKGVETRVIGTFGYLAPEYAQSGQITEKANVYSFGVVLVELITGRKAMDIKRPKGQQCLTEWERPLLQKQAIKELLDPRLMNCYSEQEVYCMALCAYLCIRRDPNSRPRMSQVLRMLEGDVFMNPMCLSSLTMESPKPILDFEKFDNGFVQKLIYDALVWSSLHGLVVGDKTYQRSGTVPGVGMMHAPIALLPTPFPESYWNQACEVAPIFNELVDRISLDGKFIQDSLSSAQLKFGTIGVAEHSGTWSCLEKLFSSFKAYEISIPYIWFCYKKTLDVVSLLLGLSAMVLLLVSTDQFTYWVAIPGCIGVLASFFLVGTRPLEFFNMMGLKINRWACYPYYHLTRCIALLTRNGQQANGNNEENPPADPPENPSSSGSSLVCACLVHLHKTMFDALHALLINSLVIALVFTAIAASRNDNTTTKKPNEKPTVKLFIFGVLFVLYLSFKAYEISIPYIWFCYKKTLDVVAIPGCISVLASFFLLGTRPLEFFNMMGLKIIRWACYPYYHLTRCIALLTCNGQQANGNDEENPPAANPVGGLTELLQR
uniref:Protein kinase domain-containing protein n=1 Tax=Brassica campestris TaxID=3711 RepID=M4CF09_BRACM